MTDECISPLRRRMIEDMTVRNFVPKTQSDYIRRVSFSQTCLSASISRPVPRPMPIICVGRAQQIPRGAVAMTAVGSHSPNRFPDLLNC
jgi:hypothetical protein